MRTARKLPYGDGRSLTETPLHLERDPPIPLDRDHPDRDPPVDRDPPGQRPPTDRDRDPP